MGIRTLLIDDEDIARRGLRVRLERVSDIEIVAECPNGAEALNAISRLAPDLAFLDIKMPQLSGFQLVEALPVERCPHIVFVTAYDQYAVRAFQVHALDYLLKPIDDDRLAETLRRVRGAMVASASGEYARQTRRAVDALGEEHNLAHTRRQSDRLAIPVGDRLTVVRMGDIDWVEASGNYVSVHVGKNAWLLRETISAMDQRLAPHGFSRIHRSTLVNINRVVELQSLANGEFSVALKDGTLLKLSRGYRDSLDQLIGGRL
jgi:two-component system, LytTR family, response regulator